MCKFALAVVLALSTLGLAACGSGKSDSSVGKEFTSMDEQMAHSSEEKNSTEETDKFLDYQGEPEVIARALYEEATGQTKTFEEMDMSYQELKEHYGD